MEFNAADFQIEAGEHQGAPVIWLRFLYDARKQDLIRSLGGTWSQTAKSWFPKDSPRNRRLAGLPPKSLGKEAMARIHPVNRPALMRMQEQLVLKSYSPSTIRTYCNELAQLLHLLGGFAADSLGPDRLRSYMLYCAQTLKLSENTLHSRLNAIKFYYEQVLGRAQFFAEIPRPKKQSQLPKVLSTAEIRRLLAAPENAKHRIMLQLCYGMGLRVSEITALKLTDVNSDRMQVRTANAKGKKDRYVKLPQTVLEGLRDYYREHRPKEYLFEGQHGGPYAIRSVQEVFKTAMRKAGIHKPVGIHALRHSYATHLHELGTDITLIQKLLGHHSLKTTLIYTHVSDRSIAGVDSPLDKL